MADRIYIGQQAEEYHSSPAIVYSRVTIEVGTDENGNILSYTAGNDTAKELVVQCPWGTQAMANALLASLNGHQYTPFGVTSSNIHPAAELGDEVEVGEGIYSAICERHIDFQTEPVTDVSAPMEEEIDDEDEYENPIRRELTRKIINDTNAVKATLTIQIGQIQLEVAGKIDGQEAQSLIDQTLNNITLSVSSGTQSNTSKITITGTGISAVSDNITLTANEINLSTATVNGYLNANNIQANSITAGKLATDAIKSSNYSYSSGNFSSAGTFLNLSDGLIRSKNFAIDASGNAYIKGNIQASSGNIGALNIAADGLEVLDIDGDDQTYEATAFKRNYVILDDPDDDSSFIVERTNSGIRVVWTDSYCSLICDGSGIKMEADSGGATVWVKPSDNSIVISGDVYLDDDGSGQYGDTSKTLQARLYAIEDYIATHP